MQIEIIFEVKVQVEMYVEIHLSMKKKTIKVKIETIFEMKTEVQINILNQIHFYLRLLLVAIARKFHKWISTAKWRQRKASALM